MILKSKIKHEDQRGFFQELVRASDSNHRIEQVSWFKINPKQRRGGHYHEYTSETFVVLIGECRVTIYPMDNYDEINEDHILKEGESIVIKPYTWHSFYSQEGAVLLVVASKEFDPKDTDTYVARPA